MSDVQFVMPSMAESEMSATNQRMLLRNQAVAHVIKSYLDHCNAVLQYGKVSNGAQWRFSQNELVELITDVRSALFAFVTNDD